MSTDVENCLLYPLVSEGRVTEPLPVAVLGEKHDGSVWDQPSPEDYRVKCRPPATCLLETDTC